MNQFHCFEIIDIFDVYIHVYNKMKKQFLISKEEKLFLLYVYSCEFVLNRKTLKMIS